MSDLVARYGARTAPRYTTYPTAADFTPAVGPDDHARWLGALEPAEPVSLYLHVPYCRQFCAYCGCHAKATLARRPGGRPTGSSASSEKSEMLRGHEMPRLRPKAVMDWR